MSMIRVEVSWRDHRGADGMLLQRYEMLDGVNYPKRMKTMSIRHLLPPSLIVVPTAADILLGSEELG